MNWADFRSVQKGNIGERLVDEYLTSQGFIPYSPTAEGAHPFDRLVASPDKKTVFIVDAKTKPARTYYPDTGIDVRHHADYMNIRAKYGMDVFLYFVDEDRGTIYGNYLHILDEPHTVYHQGKKLEYPMEAPGATGTIRYFPLEKMLHIANIPAQEVEALRALSDRNPGYAPTPPPRRIV